MKNSIVFPQFRKYPNEKAYFKIISEKEWEEIQIMGNRFTHHKFIAKIFPDHNYLHDMTHDFEKYWLRIDENEYERIKKELHF